MITTGEKVGIWKEQILAYFKVLAQHSPADAEITISHEKRNGARFKPRQKTMYSDCIRKHAKLHQYVRQLRRN
jgi:hypothetical protein